MSPQKKQNAKITEKKEPVFQINFPGTPSFFVDNIHVSANIEQVQLICGQKGPKPEDDVFSVARIYMTLPQFMRIVELFDKIKADLETKLAAVKKEIKNEQK